MDRDDLEAARATIGSLEAQLKAEQAAAKAAEAARVAAEAARDETRLALARGGGDGSRRARQKALLFGLCGLLAGGLVAAVGLLSWSSAHRKKDVGPSLHAWKTLERRLRARITDLEGALEQARASKGSVQPRLARPLGTPFDSAELLRLQRRHRLSLKTCYEAARKRDATLARIRVDVTLTIGDEGATSEVEVNVKGGGAAVFRTCLRQNIERWRFGQVGRRRISFPLIFRGS